MGKYINQLSDGTPLKSKGKAKDLIEKEEALVIEEPKEWKDGIVCVVDNGMFEAAGYCYDERELTAFKYPCGRPKTWLYIKNANQLAQ